jgi:transcriptional regulator with XRE-family HTH domain
MAASTYSPRYRRLRERLRSAREQAGLTQEEAARAFRRHQSFVSKCESGERRVDVVELEQFARLYDKPLEFFTATDRPSDGALIAAEGPGGAARSRGRTTAAGKRRRG